MASNNGDASGRIEKYRVVEFLGKGGVGAVYRAVEDFTRRQVALKVILPEHRENPELRMRFTQEARIGAQLRHPYIVQVLGGGEIRRARGAAENTEPAITIPTLDGQELLDGTLYVVFELLEGSSLKDHVAAHGLLPYWEVPSCLGPLFDAVAHMHARGFIHRDIKPGNVHFGDTLKLLDLGSAKASDEAVERFDGLERTTGTNVPMTWEYRSPETFSSPPEIDPHVDLWALASTIYRVVTGRVPFGNASDVASLVRRILTAHFTPARELDPTLPPAVDDFFARAFALSKADRFPTVEAMRDAVRDAFATPVASDEVARPLVPDTASPEASVTPAPVTVPAAHRSSPRRWGIAAAIGLAVAVLLVVILRVANSGTSQAASIRRQPTATTSHAALVPPGVEGIPATVAAPDPPSDQPPPPVIASPRPVRPRRVPAPPSALRPPEEPRREAAPERPAVTALTSPSPPQRAPGESIDDQL